MRNTECSNKSLKAATTTFKFYQRNHWEHPTTYMHWRKLLLLSERKNQPHFSADKKNSSINLKKLVHYDLKDTVKEKRYKSTHAHTHAHTHTHTHTKTHTHRYTAQYTNKHQHTNTKPRTKKNSILFNCCFGSWSNSRLIKSLFSSLIFVPWKLGVKY